MNREQMIEKATKALAELPDDDWLVTSDVARTVVDALLPQVSTDEELEVLALHTVLLDREGWAWEIYRRPADHYVGRPAEVGYRTTRRNYACSSKFILNRGPLTVVWQP